MAQLKGRADRFYANPALRDAEWDRARQAPVWLILIILAFVVAGFFAGVYADKPYSLAGWLVGGVAILTHFALGRRRRSSARLELIRLHGQA